MKNILKSFLFIIIASVIVLAVVVPAFGAKEDTQANSVLEYKVVMDLGRRTTISNMEKALDSFTEQQKGKAILEIDLKKFGDQGWELVNYERSSGFAIFKRTVQK